jgi:Amt family ammonium transporter
MTPGLAFFYGGLVKAKSVVSMIMLSFGSLALIAVLWVLYGYAITFADVGDSGWMGIPHIIGIDTSSLGLSAQVAESASPVGSFPELAFVSFQATFAIITVALISGAIADRAKFGAWMVFAGLWATLVYFPVAGWVFNFTPEDDGGWIVDKLGAIDFAGGTAVHINAGAAALALAIVLGKRFGFSKGITQPHNVPLTLIGASLLWFGWFGFNAGSQLAADGIASLVVINTIAAPAAAMLGWISIEKIRHGKGTSIGAASGAIAGLVAITPACAAVNASGALIIGAIAGALCALSVGLKFKFGYDDSLDVVAVHLVGGIVGTVMVGFVGVEVGLFNGGGTDQLVSQIIGAAAVLVYSFVATLIIGKTIDLIFGFRITHDEELEGIDLAVHAERAYEIFDNSQSGTFASSKGGQA